MRIQKPVCQPVCYPYSVGVPCISLWVFLAYSAACMSVTAFTEYAISQNMQLLGCGCSLRIQKSVCQFSALLCSLLVCDFPLYFGEACPNNTAAVTRINNFSGLYNPDTSAGITFPAKIVQYTAKKVSTQVQRCIGRKKTWEPASARVCVCVCVYHIMSQTSYHKPHIILYHKPQPELLLLSTIALALLLFLSPCSGQTCRGQ